MMLLSCDNLANPDTKVGKAKEGYVGTLNCTEYPYVHTYVRGNGHTYDTDAQKVFTVALVWTNAWLDDDWSGMMGEYICIF